MHRSRSRDAQHPSAVRAVGLASFDLVLPRRGRVSREPSMDATHRRTVFEDTVFRQSSDDRAFRSERTSSQSQTDSASDATDGDRGRGTSSPHKRCIQESPCFSVPVAKCGDRTCEPSLEYRYHLHPATARLLVSVGGAGLAQSVCARLATFQQHGNGVLHRWSWRTP